MYYKFFVTFFTLTTVILDCDGIYESKSNNDTQSISPLTSSHSSNDQLQIDTAEHEAIEIAKQYLMSIGVMKEPEKAIKKEDHIRDSKKSDIRDFR